MHKRCWMRAGLSTNRLNMTTMRNTAYHLQHAMALVGSECIFKDRGTILHVEVQSIAIAGDELTLNLKPIGSPGFTKAPSRNFHVSAVAEYLNFGQHEITASLVGWQLFTHPTLVMRLILFAAGLPGKEAFLDKVREKVRRQR
jgi:hypothetical protein